VSRSGERKPAQARWSAVERDLGTGIICTDCGCTLATYHDLCEALNLRCPGFDAIEAAERRFETEHNL
jgi:hypothetical protein